MSEQKTRVVAVGEVMVELARGGDGRFGMACGGDTFNTAVYLARAGVDVGLCHRARRRSLFRRASSRWPPPRACNRSDAARARPPARPLTDRDRRRGRAPLPLLARRGAGARAVRAARLGAHRRRHDRGAARSISPASRCRSIPTPGSAVSSPSLEMARQQGAKVAFDGNFRPRGWKGDLPRTRTVFMEALKRVDIALPTFDDEAVLWGDPSPEATVERLQAFGIGEIVVKNGPNSALVAAGGRQRVHPGAGSGRSRSIPRRRATASTPATWRRGSSGEKPAAAAAAAHRLAAKRSATAAPSCRATRPRCIDAPSRCAKERR